MTPESAKAAGLGKGSGDLQQNQLCEQNDSADSRIEPQLQGRCAKSLISNSRANLRERKDDLYETPPVAVEALLRFESLPHHIWEPACGPGSIVRVLRQHGHTVWATDLVDYGLDDSQSGIDFLMERQSRIDTEAIVSNPPFKLAAEFIEHAIALCPKVVMLLRLAFIESERRRTILDGGKLARVHVFRNRLPMMHRDGWTGKRVSNPTPFAWFVWDRDHTGPIELRRLSWDASK